MSSYSYGDGVTYYQTLVRGELTNGPSAESWWDQQDQVYAAGRQAVPFAQADFHVVYHADPNEEPSAVRWVVDGDVSGPEPTWETDNTGPAFMTFRFAITESSYPRIHEDRPAPLATEMHDVFVAALARAALGTTFVPMPTSAHETMGFAPDRIEYTRDLWTPVEAGIAEPLIGFTSGPLPPSEYHIPTLWVVQTGRTQGAMVSACYDGAGNRWDDPDRPAPSFDEVLL